MAIFLNMVIYKTVTNTFRNILGTDNFVFVFFCWFFLLIGHLPFDILEIALNLFRAKLQRCQKMFFLTCHVFKFSLKVPSHQFRSAGMWYRLIGLDGYMDRGWLTDFSKSSLLFKFKFKFTQRYIANMIGAACNSRIPPANLHAGLNFVHAKNLIL
jgi:hypothetical protein